jgi:putative transposase
LQPFETKLPEDGVHLGKAKEDLLAFSIFPKEIWRQILSSNPQERLNRETRRRTDVVGIFPDRSSIISLIGAVAMEQTDDSTESRRYMGLEVLAKVGELLTQDMDTTETDMPTGTTPELKPVELAVT